MLPQFTYIASVLDPSDSTYDEINKIIGLFINTGTTKPCTKRNWIHKDILYGPKSEGGLNFIDARSFFLSLKISWVKRYAADALDDHWADLIDLKLGVDRTNRNQILDWGTEAFNDLVNSRLPCIHSFFNAWLLFKTCFHQKSPTTHNNLLHSPLFLNPWILRKPEVADFFTYKWKVNKDGFIDPLNYGLPRNEFRHLKVLDLLDQNGIKSLESLKDELGMTKLHYLSYARLVRVVSNMERVYPNLILKSTGVSTPVDKHGKTPLDYVPNIVEAFKRIKKGSSYYRRILVQKKPMGKKTFKMKMEKRLNVTLRQGYVCKVAEMLNKGMIPTNNGDILHRLILGKTKSGEEIKDWSNQDWNGICRQCGTVLETFQHIFECEVVKNYYNDLSNHLGVYRIYDLKSLFGDHFLWHETKERPKILAQFAICSFIIAEVSAGRLTGDKLSWRRTKFKLVAYLTHLLRSDNVRYTSLGDEIKKLIRI